MSNIIQQSYLICEKTKYRIAIAICKRSQPGYRAKAIVVKLTVQN
ncbi:MAG: hypothetical protein RMY29_013575 [Nostoc sp. CreGUA01]|nr:hypothetical protein [Nostoc sp. CreGUA01]